MNRFTLTLMPLLLFAVPSLAAECGLLWSRSTTSGKGKVVDRDWRRIHTFEHLSEYRRDGRERAKILVLQYREAKWKEAEDLRNILVAKTAGGVRQRWESQCFPGTIDPRGKKE